MGDGERGGVGGGVIYHLKGKRDDIKSHCR